MKRPSAIAAVVLSLSLLLPMAAAAETVKGTVKQVDEKAGTITFSREGAKDPEVLSVEKSVDLGKVKADTKATITLEDGRVKEIKAERKRSTAGY